MDRAVSGNEIDIESWAASRKRRAPSPRKTSERAAHESAAMRESRDWSAARPEHVVALYAWCHEQTYGIPAAELDGKAFWGAMQLCRALLERQFAGDVERLVEFVHWTWARELGREKWRRENHRGGHRIGYRLQFSPSLVTDWRADELRRYPGG